MSKKYIADLDAAFDVSINDDDLDFTGAAPDEALYKLFNEGGRRGKGKKGRRKGGARAESAHRSLPHGWEDFDYVGDDYYDVDDS